MDKLIRKLKRDNAELQEQVLILIEKSETQDHKLNQITDVITLFSIEKNTKYKEVFNKILEIIEEE